MSDQISRYVDCMAKMENDARIFAAAHPFMRNVINRARGLWLKGEWPRDYTLRISDRHPAVPAIAQINNYKYDSLRCIGFKVVIDASMAPCTWETARG